MCKAAVTQDAKAVLTDLSRHLDTGLADCLGNREGVAIVGKLVQGKGNSATQGEARQVRDMSGKETGAAGTPLPPLSPRDLEFVLVLEQSVTYMTTRPSVLRAHQQVCQPRPYSTYQALQAR